ncbi:MAG: carboxy terminal-processing peptidase [Kiritimatiellae bacterium]|nr:carboxy terminal-processing peptidase [Kiritimatiellia bacterium]
MKKLSLFAALIVLGCQTGCGAEPAEAVNAPVPKDYYGVIAKKMARTLAMGHITQKPLDDSVSRQAWTNLLDLFDFDRSYFLQSDIEAFASYQGQIDDMIKAGDVSFPYEVYSVFRKRVQDRYTFVTNRLSGDFNFDLDESYAIRRKETAVWPADKEAQDDLWRKRIKSDLLGMTLSREMAEAAATNHTGQADDVVTNKVAATGGETTNTLDTVAVRAPLTPAENIAKRYSQYTMIIEDMDEEAILQRFLSAVCYAYDPHTDYMSPMRKEDFDIDMNLSLCGIGASLRSEDGMAMVMELIPGGPADRDKRDIRLISGDRIIGVGQGDAPVEDIVHQPLNKAVRKIRGEKGTKVVLEVIPASDPSGTTTKLVDLIRDDVKLEEQAATGHVARVTLADGKMHKIGVLRLPTFYATMDKRPGQPGFRSATEDAAAYIKKFNSEDVEGMILDLRNNGGGSLREAISLTGLFIRSGPVVQVRESNRILVMPVPNIHGALAFRKPMAVLINRASASASEIVAGALMDYGRAIVIGDTRSHGKGTVQTVLPLGDAKFGSLKVTTASFYRINGASTQLKGVQSAVVIPSRLEGLDIGEDKMPGALPWTEVAPTMYVPVFDINKFTLPLKKKSAERLSENKDYSRHCKIVQSFKQASERKTIPLQIDARRKLMEDEVALREMDGEESGDTKDSPLEDESGMPRKKMEDENDIVLNESMNILSDLIELSGGADMDMETEGDLATRLLQIFGRSK